MKLKNFFIMTGAGAALSFAVSCQTESPKVLNGTWIVEAVDNENVDLNGRAYLNITTEDKKLSGKAGCNRINSQITLGKGREISFGPVAATRMMCPDIETENKIIDAIGRVNSYEYRENGNKKTVTLKDSNEKEILSLTDKESFYTFDKINGAWYIVSVNSTPVGETLNTPMLTFETETSKVYGNLGCNTCSGSFSREADNERSIKFGDLAMTQMYCQGMETEDAIKTVLVKVSSFLFDDNGDLLLCDSTGNELLKLVRD